MTAIADPLNQAAVQQTHVPHCNFASLSFSTGMVYLSTWDRNFTFGGNTYIGVGQAASIGEPRDEGGMKSGSLTLTLRGMPTALTNSIADGTEKYFGRYVYLYRGYLNSSMELVATPHGFWAGAMDSISFLDDQGQSDISVNCENKLNFLFKSIGRQFTPEHQSVVSLIDVIFSKVTSMGTKKSKWGNNTV